MNTITGCIASLLFLMIAACDTSNDIKDPAPVQDFRVIAGMTQDFGWNLFQTEATGETKKNVLLSPLSAQVALSMAANGANTSTLSEMLKTLGCENCSVNDINTQTALLRTLMEEQSGHPRLVSANGFFFDPNRIRVLDSFRQTVSTSYRAGFEEYNFNDPATLAAINDWVKANTFDKIDKILDQIKDEDLAFLINALHFKADWATGFDPQSSFDGPFTNASGSQVSVKYVSADRNFSTSANTLYNMVDIPFRDSTYSLSLVQPTQDPYPASWFSNLTPDVLRTMWATLQYDRAIVRFPGLELEYDADLIGTLKQLGMTQAFIPAAADFSLLGQSLIGPTLFIHQIRHKAVLKVDEKGAEGAAVTSIGFGTTSAPPAFIYDRPFVIVLRHTATNTLLFAGLINDPS